jgi:competence protein ComEC
MPAKYFYGFILSFIFGIGAEEIFGFGFTFSLLCIILALIVPLVRGVMTESRSSLLVSLVLLGCALGMIRVDVSQMKQNTHALDSLVGKVVNIKGMVTEEPDVRENYTNIVLETQNVSQGQTRVLVRVPTYPVLRYGDEVMMVGKVAVPKNLPAKDNKKVFDYRAYLAKDRIFYEVYFPKIEVTAHGKENAVREKLFALKEVFMKNISRMIREPEAALAGGVLLGTQQSLGSELLQKFRETGVAHIVVLSGYNIAVVAGVISRLVVFMPFTVRLVASALGIIFFALMVGGSATVVRATVMALIVILARALGREGDALRVLVLAGGLMVAVNPMILLHDVSFQLSFMATFALVTLVPIFEKKFVFISNTMIREILVTTIATQFFVLPLILYYMGSISLVGIIANLFILPMIPVVMFAVALVASLGWVPLLGSAFALIAYIILAYIILAVELFARIPFASLSGISFSLFPLTVTYMLLGFFIIKKFPRVEVRKNSEYEF